MTLTSSLAVYFVTWWVTLFIVLPFGYTTQADSGEVVRGTDPSAPRRMRPLRLFLLNTCAATLIFALIYAVLRTGMLSPQSLYEGAGMHN